MAWIRRRMSIRGIAKLRASSKEFWLGGPDVSLGEIGCHKHRLFSYFLVKYVYLLCELNYNASNSQEIASLSLHYSSGSVKTTFSTVMRTLLGPRSATILTPLRGLAASLRGAAAPAVNMLEEALAKLAMEFRIFCKILFRDLEWPWTRHIVTLFSTSCDPRYTSDLNLKPLNPRPDRGGATPSLSFFADSEKTAALRAAGFGLPDGANLAQLLGKKLTRLCQVTELWRHKRNNLRQFYWQIRVLPQLDVTRWMQMIIFGLG